MTKTKSEPLVDPEYERIFKGLWKFAREHPQFIIGLLVGFAVGYLF